LACPGGVFEVSGAAAGGAVGAAGGAFLFAFLACPGGTLACPGGEVDAEGAATAGVVTAAGMLFFGPAQGGLPFAVRWLCLAAPPFQVLVVGELHLPLLVETAGAATVGTVGTVGGVGVVGGGVVSNGGGDGRRVGVLEGAAACEALGGVTTRAISLGTGCRTRGCVLAAGGETCGAGRISAPTCPRSAGAVPGKSVRAGG
jgi:hypothetical protein